MAVRGSELKGKGMRDDISKAMHGDRPSAGRDWPRALARIAGEELRSLPVFETWRRQNQTGDDRADAS